MNVAILDFGSGKLYRTKYNPEKDGDLEEFLSDKKQLNVNNCQFMSFDGPFKFEKI